MTPEFSRIFDVRHLPERPITLEADPAERAALAKRFAVLAIERLEAEAGLERAGDAVLAAGRFEAELFQTCAVSGEPLTTRIAEPFSVRFVREDAAQRGEDIELSADDLDEIAYEGTQVDLGEAVAQSLSLAIDPSATGPGADAVRKQAGLGDEASAGPFAALAALRK